MSGTLALVLFGLAAIGGLLMARQHLQGQTPAMGIAIGHGIGAAAGLILLIVFVLNNPVHNMVQLALGIFIVAALGGFLLLANHLRGKKLQTPLVFIHGIAAVIGFVLLLLFI